MKKTNNKGFSLVELIIVIAIMAILAGAIAPALIRYIDKSRKSNDVTAAKSIKTAIETALANEDVYEDLTTNGAIITVEAGKKLTTATEPTKDSVVNITINGSAASGDHALAITEIAKNIGDKTPKINYKKKSKINTTEGPKPECYYVIIDTNGAICVGIGASASAPSLTDGAVGSDGKYSTTKMYVLSPEICDAYK